MRFLLAFLVLRLLFSEGIDSEKFEHSTPTTSCRNETKSKMRAQEKHKDDSADVVKIRRGRKRREKVGWENDEKRIGKVGVTRQNCNLTFVVGKFPGRSLIEKTTHVLSSSLVFLFRL